MIFTRNKKDDEPRQQNKPKKTDEAQPDDEEVEEEVEIDEAEERPSSRPASKLDLEEPLNQEPSEDDQNEDDVSFPQNSPKGIGNLIILFVEFTERIKCSRISS